MVIHSIGKVKSLCNPEPSLNIIPKTTEAQRPMSPPMKCIKLVFNKYSINRGRALAHEKA